MVVRRRTLLAPRDAYTRAAPFGYSVMMCFTCHGGIAHLRLPCLRVCAFARVWARACLCGFACVCLFAHLPKPAAALRGRMVFAGRPIVGVSPSEGDLCLLPLT